MRLQKKNMIQIVKFRPQADNGEKNGVKTSMPKKMTQQSKKGCNFMMSLSKKTLPEQKHGKKNKRKKNQKD